MNFFLDFKSPVPLYAQLKEQILMSVASGKLVRGARLPSVRELSTTLRINPNTVIQCYRELEAEGTIATRRGQGSFVSEEARAMPSGKRREILSGEVDRLLVKAFHLGSTPDEVAALVDERLEAARIRKESPPAREAGPPSGARGNDDARRENQ